MLARVKSGALQGVDAYLVEVEVDLAPGLPAFITVGLPEAAVKESKDRVRAAVKNSGYGSTRGHDCQQPSQESGADRFSGGQRAQLRRQTAI